MEGLYSFSNYHSEICFFFYCIITLELFVICRFLGNEPHHVREDIYLARQYHGQDGLGGYLYGYNVPDISKTERKKAGGDLRGAYNYIAGNGQEIKVSISNNLCSQTN